jgi:hypothetical protein
MKRVKLLLEPSPEANELMARLSAEGWHVEVKWCSAEELEPAK